MREHILGRGSAVIAVVACLLVVGSGLAVVPGGVTAQQQQLDGDIAFDSANGELTVEVDRRDAANGSFTGGPENVTIDIGGTALENQRNDPGNTSTYTYTVGPEELADVDTLDGRNGAGTTVTVTHSEAGSFNRTVDVRYVVLDGNGAFATDGTLRFGTIRSFGVAADGSVGVLVETDDGEQSASATYRTGTGEPSLALDRDALGALGVLDQPQNITVFGQESSVQGSATVDVAAAAAERTGGERLSDGAVRFTSPLFEDGQAYTVSVSTGDAQYLRTLDAADDRRIDIDSRAVAAESSVDLTVKNSGNTVVSKQVSFSTEQLTGNVTDSGAVEFDSLPNRVETGNVTVWAEAGSGFERYDARLNRSTLTLTLRNDESLPRLENANRTALLVQFADEAPLSATVTLQQVDGNTSAAGPDDQSADGSGLLGGLSTVGQFLVLLLVAVVAVILGFLGVRALDSGTTKLSLPFGSSNGDSPGESPGVETADVSVEVVDEVAGKTYPHVTEVIARPRNQGRSTGSRRGRGNGSGRTAGRTVSRSVNTDDTDDTEIIDLTAGEGDVELGYGDWVFEARQNGETVGQRRHNLSHDYGSDHIALSVDPYVVEATVTGGPDREPLRGATVEATADAGGWKRRQPTDGEGRAEFEIPRSASTVSFTATHGNLPPAESQCRVEQAVRNGVSLAIADGAGTMRVETTVGDVSWPGVEVKLTPVSEQAKAYADEGTFTVNADGRQRVENLPAGEYELSAHPQLEAVDTTAAVEPVTVGDGDTAEVTLSIGISYRMSATDRERFDELGDRIDGLTSEPDRDVAIQRYYGTVLTSVLDVVEGVESAPERAVEAGVSPDETVEALLDATEAGITAVDGAMSERRNVSLFGACESMPPATVEWNGEATLDAFLDRVEEGTDHERRALSDRLRAVDEVLDQQWGAVNEIAPARKLHDRIGELARETGNVDDDLTAVAQAYVGICLLDAVEGIFEHDALVDRLNSGSY